MEKYILVSTEIKKPFKTLFLCGAVFKKNDITDKRVVIKNKIQDLLPEYDSIILEEHFVFAKESVRYLSYDEIFMTNLHDIEMMMGLLADKIIIVHESISTAAELGIFASNINVEGKMCILIPHKYSIEEEKLTNFIRLAFLKDTKSFEVIEFYPIIKNNEISENKKDYHTFFLNNEIGENLANKICEFLKVNVNETVSTKINKSKFGNRISGFSYSLDSSKLNVNVPALIIELLIISLLSFIHIRGEVREKNDIKGIVNILKEYIVDIIFNTIQKENEANLSELKININIDGKNKTDITLNKTIGYVLYLLQVRGYIQLPKGKGKTTITSKFTSSNQLAEYKNILSLHKPKSIDAILNGIGVK